MLRKASQASGNLCFMAEASMVQAPLKPLYQSHALSFSWKCDQMPCSEHVIVILGIGPCCFMFGTAATYSDEVISQG